jgi:hypothetical protein
MVGFTEIWPSFGSTLHGPLVQQRPWYWALLICTMPSRYNDDVFPTFSPLPNNLFTHFPWGDRGVRCKWIRSMCLDRLFGYAHLVVMTNFFGLFSHCQKNSLHAFVGGGGGIGGVRCKHKPG